MYASRRAVNDNEEIDESSNRVVACILDFIFDISAIIKLLYALLRNQGEFVLTFLRVYYLHFEDYIIYLFLFILFI